MVINALTYSSVANILRSGLDQAPAASETVKPAPPHGNIRVISPRVSIIEKRCVRVEKN
ncbi:hypothetical protein LAV90_30465 [Rhizobium sp. VS19-DR181]|nr:MULTISPECIES: hypothetical protein [unclassified Rhizobium]MBZ5769717.1 hypothetical protein [Rhizobium sp. VS19-DR129.2]MBZ5805831.1 hypothetical protein [Rhizobium sp. VS19-DR181]